MLLFIGASLLLFGTATSDLLRFEPQSKATLKLHTVLRATEAKVRTIIALSSFVYLHHQINYCKCVCIH